MIYLDNAASTRVHPDVIESMAPYMAERYGNPSSIHRYGRLARKAVERARRQVASLIGADPSEILLTSGGTESNNTALLGAASKGRVIATSIEHDAVLEPCRRLERDGLDVVYLAPDKLGMISPRDLEKSITDETCLVSVMFGNNEVGTIQPIAELARMCRSRGVLFHTDAVQAAGKIPINVGDLGVDMLSVSSHKLYGPKGAGALYVRSGIRLDPVILGGGQEDGMRSGTENVAGVVGFGRACEIARENLEANASHMRDLRDDLVRQVMEIPGSALNGHPESRLPNSAHFTFLGVNGEDLIIKLDEHGIAASTGSACSVHTQKASHVLQAMGFSLEQITGSLRMTVGVFNTKEEMGQAAAVLGRVVSELRAVSPFREKYSF
ncbi:MAG: cysteine desulfurase [Nitrosopumilus sp. H13]|nr:MAG: cysteine desulfurase [Nitrosopumilus sp. H13]